MQTVARLFAHPATFLAVAILIMIAWNQAAQSMSDDSLAYARASHPSACHVCTIATSQGPAH